VFFFLWRKSFWLMLIVIFHGIYTLGLVCLFFPALYNFVASYFPVFVLLLGVSLAVLIKVFVSIVRGIILLRLKGDKISVLPLLVRKCFCDNELGGAKD
jgi:hypothetical protein